MASLMLYLEVFHVASRQISQLELKFRPKLSTHPLEP